MPSNMLSSRLPKHSTIENNQVQIHPPTGSRSMAIENFKDLQSILEGNKKWAESIEEKEAGFLKETTKGQRPSILWIGCADSRVPETTIMGRKPGEVFVHRNIANQFQPDDDSANSLLDYAVMTVGVTHVIVAGHTHCGGCLAAYSTPKPDPSYQPNDPLTRFLDPVMRLRHSLKDDADLNELITQNVRLGVRNVVDSPIMKEAWGRVKKGERAPVFVHGWVYDLGTGHLNDLGISVGADTA